MNIFRKKMNRKLFGFSIFCVLICTTLVNIMVRSPDYSEVVVGILSATSLVLLFLSIHLRRNDINGCVDVANSIKYILLSCIPLVSLFVLMYLLFTRGKFDKNNDIKFDSNSTNKNNSNNVDCFIDELQDKYSRQITNINDDSLDEQICSDLYETCNKINLVRQVILNRNIGLTDMIAFYRAMKCDDILWDDDTGKYLPFVAMFNPDILSLFASNKNLPDVQLKHLVMSALKNASTMNYEKHTDDKSTDLFSRFNDLKRVWILIFLIVSICIMLYPPYQTTIPNKGTTTAGYSFIGTTPSGVPTYNKKFTSVDYSTLIFHEIIWAVICGAGYTLTVILKKR